MNYHRNTKKKFIVWLVAALCIAALTLSITMVAQAVGGGEAYRTIRVVETNGSVSVVKDDIEYRAYPGMLLQEGHAIVVAGGSYARLALDDDKYVKVEAGSRVVFETLGVLGSGKTTMNLERGSLTAELVSPLLEGQEFVVNTPNAVLAVRGTFFRVDLTLDKKGEVLANVMTYGGKVATKRVFPSGETEEEEVLVEAGYKTAINMDATDTVYVVQKTSTDAEDDAEGTETVVPINREEISDDDMVDIYFAAENGHELFVSVEEVLEDIENREINLDEKVSVYQLTEEVLKQENAAAEADLTESEDPQQVAFADDSKTLEMVRVEEEEKVTRQAGIPSEDSIQQATALVDGPATEVVSVHTHTKVTKRTEPSCDKQGAVIVTCSDCGEVLSEKPIPATGHSEKTISVAATCTINGSHKVSCTTCGKTISEVTIPALAHSMQDVVTEPTCTEDGSVVSTCSICGHTEQKVGALATGHNKVTESKSATCTTSGYSRTSCSTCGKVLSESTTSAAHKPHETRVSEPTCQSTGLVVTACSVCNVVLSETELGIGDHVPEFVGTMNFHSQCSVCGNVLETVHSYEEEITVAAGCERAGEKTLSCECGYFYTEEIPARGHNWQEVFSVPDDMPSGCKYDYCDRCMTADNVVTIYGINAVNFPDENFRAYVEGRCNTDEAVGLTNEELEDVDVMLLSSDVAATNLKGIELFPNLMTLSMFSPTVQEINVSGNTTLRTLSLDGATGLKKLNCKNTQITNLDVGDCTNLQELDCSGTQIELLDTTNLPVIESVLATNCSKLNTLTAGGCEELVSLDASGCTLLESVDLAGDLKLEDLNLAGDTALSLLDLNSCMSLTSLDVSFADELSYLTVTYCWELTSLDIENTDVTTLDLTEVTKLQELNVSRTKLSMLNVNDMSSLTRIDAVKCESMLTLSAQNCSNLAYVDASSCGELTGLNISNTSVSTLDLTDVDKLQELNVSRTKLSTLDVDGFNNLTRIDAVNCESMSTLSAQNCSSLSYVDVASSSLNYAYLNSSAALVTLNLSNNMALGCIEIRNCTSLGMVDVTYCGSTFGNCIIYSSGSSITSQEMITGFDGSYMTYRTD